MRKQIQGLPDLSVNTIFCIGRNYAEHARELKNKIPTEPVVFLKPKSSLIYNNQVIHLPAVSHEIHHEIELVVAIGKKGKNIPSEKAQDYIAGYGIGIDVTARDIQQKAKSNGHPWSVAKGFDTFAPISSFVPADEVEDPQNLDLKLAVNGTVRQQDNTSKMIFPVPSLISHLSAIFTLHAGDLIFTGTPSGVSPLEKGDKIVATLNQNLCSLNLSVE